MDETAIIAVIASAGAFIVLVVCCAIKRWCPVRSVFSTPFSSPRLPRGSLRRLPSVRSNSVLSIVHPHAVNQLSSAAASSRSIRIAPAPHSTNGAPADHDAAAVESVDSTSSSTVTVSEHRDLQRRRSRADIIKQASERGRELAMAAAAAAAGTKPTAVPTVVVQPPLLPPPRSILNAFSGPRKSASAVIVTPALAAAASTPAVKPEHRHSSSSSVPRLHTSSAPPVRMSPSMDFVENGHGGHNPVALVSSVVVPIVNDDRGASGVSAAAAVVEPSPDRPLNRIKFVPGNRHGSTRSTTSSAAAGSSTSEGSPVPTAGTASAVARVRREDSREGVAHSNEIV